MIICDYYLDCYIHKCQSVITITVNLQQQVPHLRYLRTKCLKALNLLHVVAHTSWEGDQQTMLHLYRSLIRSKLDYGCIVYGSTRNSYLKMLEPI